MDGSSRLFREIFQETSSGDFGIQVKNGPLFRCHSSILKKAGGFCGKVRQFGQLMQRSADHDHIQSPLEYFKSHGNTRLLKDIQNIRFSEPPHRSGMNKTSSFSALSLNREDPLKPGFTTAHFIGGTTGAIKRADPFFLAERYELECDCELMAELLRFIYQGKMAYFDEQPENEREHDALTKKMLEICFDAEKFSVDALYEKLLEWFGSKCYFVVGERNFADAFYHLQHFEYRATEEHSRKVLIKTISQDMLATKQQFQAITRDHRWSSLPVEFVENTLNYDGMPISSEVEVLNLIERWNSTADKSHKDIVRLLKCFRPNAETRQAMRNWLQVMGWVSSDGRVQNVPGLEGLKDVLNMPNSTKKPRNNLFNMNDTDLVWQDDNTKKDSRNDENEALFLHYSGARVIDKGSSFLLGSQQRLLQADTFRDPGIYRLRVALSEPKNLLWNPDHEVFVGVSYGEGRYFGFLCSASAFSGIFCVRALASAAPAPSAPVHLTGSGNKVEFDLSLEVQMQRVDLVVTCKLGVVFRNETITQEIFQISYETLVNGAGLRFQVVGTGLQNEKVLTNLAWVGGGGPVNDKEVDYGPIGFIDDVNY